LEMTYFSTHCSINKLLLCFPPKILFGSTNIAYTYVKHCMQREERERSEREGRERVCVCV
jgi:hypothetical protein